MPNHQALIVAALATLLGLPGCSESPTTPAVACSSGRWQTTLALDDSSPERASASTSSTNAVGGSKTCAQMTFACLAGGPYLELRVRGPELIRSVGAIELRGMATTTILVGMTQVDGGKAVRIVDKDKIEAIANAFLPALIVKIPLDLQGDTKDVARFNLFGLSEAIRPVAQACRMKIVFPAPDEDTGDTLQ